jgi:hypothetical protein
VDKLAAAFRIGLMLTCALLSALASVSNARSSDAFAPQPSATGTTTAPAHQNRPLSLV